MFVSISCEAAEPAQLGGSERRHV